MGVIQVRGREIHVVCVGKDYFETRFAFGLRYWGGGRAVA